MGLNGCNGLVNARNEAEPGESENERRRRPNCRRFRVVAGGSIAMSVLRMRVTGHRSGRPFLGRASQAGAADPCEAARAAQLLDLASADLALRRPDTLFDRKAPDAHAALPSGAPNQRFAPHIGQRPGDLYVAIPYLQTAQNRSRSRLGTALVLFVFSFMTRT
jgi:hypothetical protein